MKKGDKVKLSEKFKEAMINSGCGEHVGEFGDCEGIVEDQAFENGEGNEVNVRWQPSQLRYMYDPVMDLIKIK